MSKDPRVRGQEEWRGAREEKKRSAPAPGATSKVAEKPQKMNAGGDAEVRTPPKKKKKTTVADPGVPEWARPFGRRLDRRWRRNMLSSLQHSSAWL